MKVARYHTWQYFTLLSQTLKVLDVIREIGEPILLKGAALALSVYPNGMRRDYGDIDILVRREHIDAACRQLVKIGYYPVHLPIHPRFYEAYHFHRILKNAAGTTVELHWDLTCPRDYVQFDTEGFIQRAHLVDLKGHQVRIPEITDQLLHTTSQILVDGYSELRRVVDAALLLKHGAVNPALIRRAREQNLRSALWLLMEIAQTLAGVDVSETMKNALCPHPFAKTCLESLHLADRLLAREVQRYYGAVYLIRWLCSPSADTAAREVVRFVIPGEAEFLEAAVQPEALPGLPRRGLLALRRLLSLARIAAYQSRSLIGHFRAPVKSL